MEVGALPEKEKEETLTKIRNKIYFLKFPKQVVIATSHVCPVRKLSNLVE